jgi:hypothetical protein
LALRKTPRYRLTESSLALIGNPSAHKIGQDGEVRAEAFFDKEMPSISILWSSVLPLPPRHPIAPGIIGGQASSAHLFHLLSNVTL